MSPPLPGSASGEVRVLHLLDLTGPVVPWDAIASCRACLNVEGDRLDQRVIVFGPARSVADARALGVHPLRSICPPRARMDAAVSALDLASREIEREWPPTVVQVWSENAHRAAAEVYHHVQIVEGVPGECVPAPDMSRREPLRRALEVRPGETVILLATDHAGVGDGRRLVGVLGVLELDDMNALGVMSDRTETHHRAVRFLAAFDRQWDATTVGVPPMAYLPAADIVVWDQGDNSIADDARAVEATGGTASAAAAAGIPVVTTDTPLARALLGPAGDLTISRDGSHPEFSRSTCVLMKDAGLRARVGELLRAHSAATHKGCDSLLARWRGATRAARRAVERVA